ncbi:uncharacterized protein LOC142640315 [Castanea sativa]|uniref:uncharacterized protein LOC142640315 n=1 Tax=Castanea sativa TaxID=21020 RepID=UPI003F64E98D
MDLVNDSDFDLTDNIVLATYIAGCACVACVETYMTKVPMHTNIQTRYEWVQYILNGNEQKYHNIFRMSSHVFRQLCNTLRTQYEYNGTKRVCLEESVAMTLVVLGHASSNKVVQDRFQHSGETVHQHVATVVTLLATVMAPDIIKLANRTFRNVPEHIQHSDQYWPHFKGCIGAIDEVHVEMVVPVDEQHPYRGKYYLVDSGYPMKQGFLAPYKGERNHIPKFNRGEQLHRLEEKFNYLHSSLRSVIERTFGVWKNKWKILRSMSPFHLRTQCHIIVATIVLHNFIRAHENNNGEYSNSAGDTYEHSEGGHYDAMADVISMLDEAEMREVRNNITSLICS